jgi:vesicle-fusing ATPase
VNDTVVNQLLSKIDGVNSLNNVLLIGMTNRKDMIDEAVLRPGRLELHLEISLPDEAGRTQIFEIHTRKMRNNKLIHDSVDLSSLAGMTKNFTGAEIESVCKNAISIALYKGVDVSEIGKQAEESKKSSGPKSSAGNFEFRQIFMEDFLQALSEIKPAFGIDEEEIDT